MAVRLFNNSPSSCKNETPVGSLNILDSQSPFIFWSTNVLPSSKTKRFGISFFPNSCPPEVPNNRSELGNKLFGEKYVGHIVNWNGGENRFDELKLCSMRKFIGLVCCELGFEFIKHEVVGYCSILNRDDERMPKMNEVVVNGWHRQNLIDSDRD